MNLVNAGIKSYGEAATRLEAGEVFYYEGKKIKFDAAYPSPFRFGSNSLFNAWPAFPHWRREGKWYEIEGVFGNGPIPCWVWDLQEDKGKYVSLVSRFAEGFNSEHGCWLHAEPIKPEECLGGESA